MLTCCLLILLRYFCYTEYKSSYLVIIYNCSVLNSVQLCTPIREANGEKPFFTLILLSAMVVFLVFEKLH